MRKIKDTWCWDVCEVSSPHTKIHNNRMSMLKAEICVFICTLAFKPFVLSFIWPLYKWCMRKWLKSYFQHNIIQTIRKTEIKSINICKCLLTHAQNQLISGKQVTVFLKPWQHMSKWTLLKWWPDGEDQSIHNLPKHYFGHKNPTCTAWELNRALAMTANSTDQIL